MNRKCTACDLVNFSTSDACRRCGADLAGVPPANPALAEPRFGGRTLGRWLGWTATMAATILALGYASLLATSDGLPAEQAQVVAAATGVLERAGFEREAFLLRHAASFRSTDNWWNRYLGHQTAYAATNFPFAVITLYPAFFRFPVDDVERAMVLLHEAHHLRGEDEPAALQRVWLEKGRLGWTAAAYGHTRLWRNTREWTAAGVPLLFHCGSDGRSDCLE